MNPVRLTSELGLLTKIRELSGFQAVVDNDHHHGCLSFLTLLLFCPSLIASPPDGHNNSHTLNIERALSVGKPLCHMLLCGTKMTEQTWSVCSHSRHSQTGNINSDSTLNNLNARKEILLLYEPNISIKNYPIFSNGFYFLKPFSLFLKLSKHCTSSSFISLLFTFLVHYFLL